MKIVQFLLSYVWLLRLIIEVLEEVADDWSGADKKELALKVISEFAENQFGTEITDTWTERVGWVVDIIVSIYNAIGVFRKK